MARIGGKGNAYRVLDGKTELKISLGRFRLIRENNIKVDVKNKT